MNTHISYKKVRDLGGIFSAAFGFIKQNTSAFFGSLLVLAGPFILIYSTVVSMSIGSAFDFTSLRTSGYERLSSLAGAYSVAIIFGFIATSVYSVVINKSVLENESLSADQKISMRQIMSGFFHHYWRFLGNILVFLLISMVLIGMLGLLVGLCVLALSGGGSGGIVFGAFLILLAVAAGFIFLPVLSYVPIAAFFVCQRNGIGIVPALRHVFFYLKGNFWNTWVVSFIAMLTYSILSFFTQLPLYIVTFITAFSRVQSTVGYGDSGQESTPLLLVFVTALCTIMAFMVSAIYYLMCIYQFGHLEEKQEGKSILDKINAI